MDDSWVDISNTDPEERVQKILPGVKVEISSNYNPLYNCIAWAIGDEHHLWDPEAWWPPGAPKGYSVTHLSKTYEMLGFEPCGMDWSLDEAFDKIAITEADGEWQHACKQCPDGRWWSKLGEAEDVKHELFDIESQPDYGRVVLILRRRRKSSEHS